MKDIEKIGVFTTTSLETKIDIQKIVTLHYFKYTKDFKFSGEKHDFWEIAYVDKGEVGVAADNSGFDLRQGEAIFHKPNEYHNIWAKNQYANIIIISFVCHSPAMSFFENKIIKLNNIHQALLANIISAGEACFSDPLDDVYQTKLNIISQPPFGSAQVIKNYIELLLIRLIQDNTDFSRKERVSRSATMQNETRIVEAVEQFLADNIYTSITFSDVLQNVCFSKSYLTKLFRRHTGMSVMEYYLNLKISESQKLISERELSFTEVAEKLKFSSIHYFSRIFKNKIGMTPSEYEKSVKSKAVL